MPRLTRLARATACSLLVVSVVAACTPKNQGSNLDPGQIDSVEMPDKGACRVLSPDDIAEPSNATKTVDCHEDHTAETFAVGALPGRFNEADFDDHDLGVFAYQTCAAHFQKFLGGDESTVMRTIVSWAWFRPSSKAWDDGARWYRCDVVGGGAQSKAYVDLPTTAKGLLDKRADKWMVCVNGPSVDGAKISCDEPHTWRAVTTIKVGQADDTYPGDKLVESRTRDFCSESVGAWLNYPADYDYGYTWFHEGEWSAGNRRSICWARTDK